MSPSKQIKKLLPRIRLTTRSGSKKPGTAPGTVQHTGHRRVKDVYLTLHDYDSEHVDHLTIENISDSKPYLESPSKTWIEVRGLHDVELLKNIWSYFELHPLIQEDIVQVTQRPKAEHYTGSVFFVLRMLKYSEEEGILEAEQVSIVLGKNYVLSFQESDEPIFEPIKNRLKSDQSRIRRLGPDYLAYALIDTVVDYYFGVIEKLGERMENIEDELMQNPDDETFQHIHLLRREIIFFRKAVWPLRDMINSTVRDESPLIDESIKVYLRDVYDHTVQIIDTVENYREMIMGMHDVYMSHISNKMNEVMKVLTIIATIFIPLTFIAGIYGMNFNPESSPYNMPELNWYWGYPAIMMLMLVLSIWMIIYFRKKRWL